MFSADRTCCICRQRGRPVQIHHIDTDPSNNDIVNLAVLCTDCHNDTQLKGGFGRQLDAHQVRLYRDDWDHLVRTNRVPGPRNPTGPAILIEGCDDVVLEQNIISGYERPIEARDSRGVDLRRTVVRRRST